MTAMTRHRGRSALAVGTVLSLGVLGALATGTAATAASIDTTKLGSIIINKYANPGNGDQQPDGSGTNPGTAPVKDVEFEYCTIDGIDLFDGTNKGFDAINAITDTEKLAAAGRPLLVGQPGAVDPRPSQLGSHTLSNCTVMAPTNDLGISRADNLPLGVYFVREVSAPTSVVELSAPFIVTLPTPKDHKNLSGDWQYEVNVYPKNTIANGPVKNVVKQDGNGALLGSQVEYQVTQLIPNLANGQTYTKFVLTDELDPKLIPSTAVPVKVSAIDSGTKTDFVSGTDYVAAWSGQTLTVTFTPAGLAKLTGATNVVFAFEATVKEPGDIENKAFVNLNDFTLTPGVPNETDGSPTNSVNTRWGDLTLQKVNAANTSDGLLGAEFHVYMGTTDSGCTPDITGLTKVVDPATGNPYVATSDSAGTIFIKGLWIGDTEKTVAADGTVSMTTVPGHDFTERCYVLEEIKSPNGFVLPTGAGALTEVLVKAGANGAVPVTKIENTQQIFPELPFTGSNVQLALTIGGIALLIIALGGVLIIRRRNANRETA